MFLYFWLFQSYERLKSIERDLIDVLIIAATNILTFFDTQIQLCYGLLSSHHNMLFAPSGYQQSACSIHYEPVHRGTEGQSGHIACSVQQMCAELVWGLEYWCLLSGGQRIYQQDRPRE